MTLTNQHKQVRDLLHRTGKVSGNVGRYVLYAGKPMPVSVRGGARQSKKSWMEGLVISQKKTMCEVLYLNGWVLWHAEASFEKIVGAKLPKRTSRCL